MKTENRYTETDLGNISLNPRGEYDPAVSYEYLDTVSLDGGSYMCLADLGNPIVGIAPVPETNTEHWQLLTLPGGLTPEYVTMHDEVATKANQVEASRAAVELSQSEVEAMQADVAQMHEDVRESAQSASDSKEQAAGYASAADTSRQAAEQAKQDVDAQIPNIDAKLEVALKEIDTTRQNANASVKKQEEVSIQGVKDQTEVYIEKQKEQAKKEISQKVEGFEIDVNAIKKEVSDEGKTQVEAVQGAQRKAIEAVGTAKTEAVEAVQTEGTTQTGNVTAEGGKQVQAVQAAAQEIVADREQIRKNKEDILVLQEEVDVSAPGIIETATGESIVLDDSSDKPMAGLHIYGKSEQTKTNGYQLLDILKAKQMYGILDEVRNDGFTWTYSSERDDSRLVNIPCDLKKGVQYVLNAEVSSAAISFYLPETMQYFLRKVPFIPTENITKFGVYVQRSDDNHGVYKVSNLIVNEGSSPKPFEPYTGGKSSPSPEYPQEIEKAGYSGTIEIALNGVNVLRKSELYYNKQFNYVATAKYINDLLPQLMRPGVIFTVVIPQEIIGLIANVSIRDSNSENINTTTPFFENKNYVLTRVNDSLYDTSENVLFIGLKKAQPTEEEIEKIKNMKIMLLYGDWTNKKIPEYEENKQQTLTLQTPNGLPGIPVKSDGNYTDSSGQQWICDEIDLERGKYVQRVRTVRPNINENTTVYETEDYTGRYAISIGKNYYFKGGVNCFITHGQYGSWAMKKNTFDINSNLIYYRPDETMTVVEVKKKIIAMCNDDIPFTICGILVNPIERDLSPEEIQQYKQLHTHYPNTSILNSGSAGMKVDYIADTKAYIFKKIESPLQKQIIDLQNALISGKISGGYKSR